MYFHKPLTIWHVLSWLVIRSNFTVFIHHRLIRGLCRTMVTILRLNIMGNVRLLQILVNLLTQFALWAFKLLNLGSASSNTAFYR